MGPLKKKQVVRSTVTLHNFFDPGASRLGKQKSHTTQSKIIGTHSSKRAVSRLPGDIIVIDSDSDDASGVSHIQGTQRIKKRRLSWSSDEVEFVDQVQLRTVTGPAQPSKRSIKSGNEGVLHKASTKTPLTSEQIRYGEPASILTSSPNTDSSSCPQDVVLPSFGTPFLLFPTAVHPHLYPSSDSQTWLTSPGNQVSESKHHQPPSCSSSGINVNSDHISSQMDLEFPATTFDDDWAMCDDETTLEPPADDEEDDVYDLNVSVPLELSDSTSRCATTSQTVRNFMQVLLYYEAHCSLGCEGRRWRLPELKR
jgi:hypothetical protein